MSAPLVRFGFDHHRAERHAGDNAIADGEGLFVRIAVERDIA